MFKVYVSPSCQDKNNGYGNYNEELMMNLIADEMEMLLERNGIAFERNNPTDAIGYVVQKANAYKPHLHIALHSNAFNQKARGLEIWHNAQGTEAAKVMYKQLDGVVPVSKNRGIKLGDNLYETSMTKHPTLLIEYDFHDTQEGATFIQQNIKRLAQETVKGLCLYLSVPYKEEAYTHWGEKPYESLKAKGINISEKRFDDFMTRAEVFALLDRIVK